MRLRWGRKIGCAALYKRREEIVSVELFGLTHYGCFYVVDGEVIVRTVHAQKRNPLDSVPAHMVARVLLRDIVLEERRRAAIVGSAASNPDR
ncbi:hypothetical protein BO1005MUT1_180145 [Hyphomicrobiales bacterium]|nr:hypothetical protein BO1005MUT1_180145 [Hyphomicrobiales bacterium]